MDGGPSGLEATLRRYRDRIEDLGDLIATLDLPDDLPRAQRQTLARAALALRRAAWLLGSLLEEMPWWLPGAGAEEADSD